MLADLSRRHFLTLAGAAGLTAAGVAGDNWLPLLGPAEGAEKGDKKKPHEKQDKKEKDEKEKDKDDCKKEGWRKFTNPTFKNQGECVSYVERQKPK